jgi:hypothetical protein
VTRVRPAPSRALRREERRSRGPRCGWPGSADLRRSVAVACPRPSEEDAVDTRIAAAPARAAQRDPWLRALVTALPVPDGERAAGPLSGLPIVVKGRAGLASVQTRRLVAAGAVPIAVGELPAAPAIRTIDWSADLGFVTDGDDEVGATAERATMAPAGTTACR